MRRRQAGRSTPLFFSNWLAALLCGLAGCTSMAGVEARHVLPSPTVASPPVSTSTPLPGQNAPAACAAGTIEAIDVPTAHLDAPLHASVYLPPCYAGHPAQRYAVLYLFHGQGDTDQQWIRLGAPRAADRLIAAGQVPPFIIVMPYDPLVREPTQYGFEAAVLGELIPSVDGRYRTLADRLHRAVGGLSRGSGWALRLGLTHPELFGAVGAHSVVVFASDAGLLGGWLAAIPAGSMPRLYLDIGSDDGGLANAVILEDMLTAGDIPHEWHLNLGSHDEAYWSRHVEAYLRWYAAGW